MATEPIEVWMIFQVVAATEEAAVEALQEHIDALESEKSVSSVVVDMDEVQRVEKPHPQIDEGYSQVCEVDMQVKNFAELVNLVINYGPTSIDVKAPESLTMDLAELRESLNAVAQMMHQFLRAGAGGMMISRAQDQ